MGQYFLIVNTAKRQYLNPHCFGDGLRLMEFGVNSCGVLTALTLLLRQSDQTGGGDFHGDHPLVGTWAGDPIAIVGDYDSSKLFTVALKRYENISHEIRDAMRQDEYVSSEMSRTENQPWCRCECPENTLRVIEGSLDKMDKPKRLRRAKSPVLTQAPMGQ